MKNLDLSGVSGYSDTVDRYTIKILHRVLLIARVKISPDCNTINFSEDYFCQQYHIRATKTLSIPNINLRLSLLHV